MAFQQFQHYCMGHCPPFRWSRRVTAPDSQQSVSHRFVLKVSYAFFHEVIFGIFSLKRVQWLKIDKDPPSQATSHLVSSMGSRKLWFSVVLHSQLTHPCITTHIHTNTHPRAVPRPTHYHSNSRGFSGKHGYHSVVTDSIWPRVRPRARQASRINSAKSASGECVCMGKHFVIDIYFVHRLVWWGHASYCEFWSWGQPNMLRY